MNRSLTAKETERIRRICDREQVPHPVAGSLDISHGALIFTINGNSASANRTADALFTNHLNAVTKNDEVDDRTVKPMGAMAYVRMRLNDGELFKHPEDVPPSTLTRL